MKHKQTIFIFVLAALSFAVLVFILIPDWRERSSENKQAMPGRHDEAQYRPSPVDDGIKNSETETREKREEYLRSNISSISPEKEVLGGKFYVTSIDWPEADRAVVKYEDGHIAFEAVAVFEPGLPSSVSDFTILPEAREIIRSSNYDAERGVRNMNVEADMILSSPLEVAGEASGNWFFESTLPVKLVDREGNIISQAGAWAQADALTSDYVPFKASLEFATEAADGYLVIANDNPSGLPENEVFVKIPVRFK